MKVKTIKKVVEGKKVKKTATISEIREAIAYWKGRLASLNEAGGDEIDDDDVINPDDDEDSKGGDVDADAFGLPDEESLESKAKSAVDRWLCCCNRDTLRQRLCRNSCRLD